MKAIIITEDLYNKIIGSNPMSLTEVQNINLIEALKTEIFLYNK